MTVAFLLLSLGATEVRQINSWQLEGGADDGARVVYGYDYYTVISNGGLEELAAAVASEEAHEEAGRRRKLHQADPVNSIRLSVLLKSCLEAAGGIHGEGFERAVAAMDETLKAQLQLAIGGAARPHH